MSGDVDGMLGGVEISRVRYDGGVVAVSWRASPNPATTFVVEVDVADVTIAAIEAGRAMSVSFPIDLRPGDGANVAVQAYIGASPKARSEPVDVVVDTASVTSAETDPATGALTLTWDAAAGERFLVRLAVNGAPPDPEAAVTGGSVTYEPPPQPPGSVAAATLARVTTSGAAESIGPHGRGFALPTGRPDLREAGFDGSRLHAEWTPVMGAVAYRLTLLDGPVVVFQADVPAPATAADVEPDVTNTCDVVVQAVDATGSGPPSAPLALLAGAPTIDALIYDDGTLAISVGETPGVTPTGYDVTVLRAGAPVVVARTGLASPLRVDAGGCSGARYTVEVRARAGLTWGPSTTAPAVLVAPEVVSVVCGESLLVTTVPDPLPAGTVIDAVLLVDGTPGTPQQVGPDGTTTFPVPAGAAAIEVRAVEGVATGPWSAPVPAPTAPPVLTAATAGAGVTDLAWSGTPGASYRVELGGTAVVVSGDAVRLPLAGPTVAVTEVAGVAAGPTMGLALLTEGPTVAAVTVGADRVVTIPWTAPAGPAPDTIQPVVRWDGAEVVLPAASADLNPVLAILPTEVPSAATLALRATAGVVTSPVGDSATVLTAAPLGLAATYDGATVRASWEPVPAASGYRGATVVGGVVTHLGDSAGPAGAWPLTTVDEATRLVVRALAGEAAGPPSAPVALFPPSLFVGPSYVAPQTGPALAPATIELLLPQLFGTPPAPAALTDLPLGVTLTPAAAPYAWTLTVPATSPVWTFTGRIGVIAAWRALVDMLQSLTATPYGLAILTEAVSRSIPQTFAETLFFAYGLEFARGCVDLRPGVVLRVEYESYQAAPGAQGAPLSGYVTTAVADYEVASYDRAGTWSNGLDAFLAALSQGGVTVPSPGSPGVAQQYGGGGGLDAFTTTMQLPFIRLVYPPEFLATTSPGSLYPNLNAVLLAAATPAALETATANIRRRVPPGGGVATVYLRGRTSARAMVRVLVDGVPRLVALGTTLGNLLAALGRRPPSVAAPIAGVTLRRPRAAAVVPAGPRPDWNVRLDWVPGDPARLDLPLLHGDRLDVDPGSRAAG